MRAFVEMRKFIQSNGQVFDRLTNVEYKLLEQGKTLTEHEENLKKYLMIAKNEKRNSSKKYFSMDRFMMRIV